MGFKKTAVSEKLEVAPVAEVMIKHNHVTRDIKRPGECPRCDTYHESEKP